MPPTRPHAADSPNCPFAMYDGGLSSSPQLTTQVNEQVAPADTSYDGLNWSSLGTVTVDSGTLTVKLSADCNYLNAVGIYIRRLFSGGFGGGPCQCSCQCGKPAAQSSVSPGDGIVQTPGPTTQCPGYKATDPQPIISLDYQLPQFSELPDYFAAQLLTFNTGSAYGCPPIAGQPVYYYGTSGLSPGDTVNVALQVKTGTLPTGHYAYQVAITRVLRRRQHANHVFQRQPGHHQSRQQPVRQLLVAAGAGPTGRGQPRGDGRLFQRRHGLVSVARRELCHTAGKFQHPLILRWRLYARQRRQEQRDVRFLRPRHGEIDAQGNQTLYAYNPDYSSATAWQLTSVTDPLGHATVYAYYTGVTSNGMLYSITDPAGDVTTFGYTEATIAGNTYNLLTSASQPDPNAAAGTAGSAMTSTYAYIPGTNLLQTWTNGNGGVYQYAYDFANRLLGTTYPNGQTVTLQPQEVNGLPNLDTEGYDVNHLFTPVLSERGSGGPDRPAWKCHHHGQRRLGGSPLLDGRRRADDLRARRQRPRAVDDRAGTQRPGHHRLQV